MLWRRLRDRGRRAARSDALPALPPRPCYVQHRRRRQHVDVTFLFWRTGMLALLAAVALGARPRRQPRSGVEQPARTGARTGHAVGVLRLRDQRHVLQDRAVPHVAAPAAARGASAEHEPDDRGARDERAVVAALGARSRRWRWG
ncbi:MAG: hypothetical protein MZW92_51680 [Comamonadaceae bacterium]|nr:hypothetical protein [Comamonadaceae bacterium]